MTTALITLCGTCTERVRKGTDPKPDCKACDKLTALAELRALCPPGTTVYTILRSVSRSGMSREISVLVRSGDRFLHPNYYVSLVTGHRLNRSGWRDALVSKGCGFAHAESLVQDLAYALYGKNDALQHQDL